MDHATVALFLAFSCATARAADAAATAPAAAVPRFGYPDDEHVIITQYGPMRYEPLSADQLNRPYEHDGLRITPARGYYKAEVIPLDMKTWKPLSGGGSDGSWVGRGVGAAAAAAGPSSGRHGGTGPGRAGPTVPGRFVGGGGGGEFDTFDVPLRVGYSVRPTKPVRQRRHNYFLTSPHGQLHRYPGPRSPPPRPAAAEDLWRP